MKIEMNADLLPFYFGTIDDGRRLRMERKLLEEPDALVDYFDLKREIEAALPVPTGPSAQLWRRLSEQVARSPRKAVFAFSLGLAVAACLLVCVLLFSRPGPRPAASVSAGENGILFDPGRELLGGSGVL
jgi:hypothetical protein